MMSVKEPQQDSAPGWVLVVGVVVLVLALLFFMVLVVLSVIGYDVPCNGRFLAVVVLALAGAIGAAFLGGGAAVKGGLPLVADHPIFFSAAGGVAVLVILLAVGHYAYAADCSDGPDPVSLSIQRVDPSRDAAGTPRLDITFMASALSANDQVIAEVYSEGDAPPSVRRPVGNVSGGRELIGLPNYGSNEGSVQLRAISREGVTRAVSNSVSFELE